MYGAFFNYYENCFVMKNYAVGSCYWKTKVTLGAMVRGPSHRLVLPPPTPAPVIKCELIFVHSRRLVSMLRQFSLCCLRHISANVGIFRIRASL